MNACCMCGRRVAVLYGDYGICLPCVPPAKRLTARASLVEGEPEGAPVPGAEKS